MRSHWLYSPIIFHSSYPTISHHIPITIWLFTHLAMNVANFMLESRHLPSLLNHPFSWFAPLCFVVSEGQKMEIHFTAVRGSKDCVAVPAAAQLVLAHAALKPDRVAAVQGEKTKTQPQIWCLGDLRYPSCDWPDPPCELRSRHPLLACGVIEKNNCRLEPLGTEC